jgi:hypothetical protein
MCACTGVCVCVSVCVGYACVCVWGGVWDTCVCVQASLEHRSNYLKMGAEGGCYDAAQGLLTVDV